MIHILYKSTIILNWKWISEMQREMLWCDKREVESEKERTRKLMNNDSAGRTIGASGLILSLLFSCLNIYFPPPPVSPVISVMGERWRRQLYEINALCDYGASSSWIRESRVVQIPLVFVNLFAFRRIKKSSIWDSSISFSRYRSVTFHRVSRIPKFCRCRWSIDFLLGDRRLP